MDVKFINPFLNGASEVIRTMAFLEAVAGKPYLKKDDAARGDVSGIIGITGDAVGSLAISFSEGCICGIVNSMLGEAYSEPTQDVLDAAGELTNMISGVARTNLEKMGLQVYAAIPSVIFGKDHTIRHILKSPSIVIPFSTEKGDFVVDVCIRATAARTGSRESYQVVNRRTAEMFGLMAEKTKERLQSPVSTVGEVSEEDRKPALRQKEPETEKNRREAMKEALESMINSRRDLQKLLAAQPFMPRDERKKMSEKIVRYDKKIRKLKLDLSALEVLSRLSAEDLQNPTIKKHYQHY